jgi:hypothetical protein
MTTLNGQVTSYSNTVPQKRTLTDRIILASPYDVTTILRLGTDNGSKFGLINWPNRTYEWLQDSYPARSDALASTNITNSTTTTTITVTTGAKFQVGDIIQVDEELMYVASIASNVLTVVRGHAVGTSSQATHESTATAYIRFTARLEGADSSGSASEEVVSVTNCTQIFHKEILMSRNAQDIPQYGIADPWGYKQDKAMDILMEELDRVPFYGRRAAGTVTASRSTGGFREFITTNVTDLNSVALTRANIDTQLDNCFAQGGRPNVFFLGSYAKRKVGSFYEGFVRTERSEQVGGILIDRLQHPVQNYEIELLVDRNCASTDLWGIDDRYAGYVEYLGFMFEPLAKTGDADKGQVIGEYGMVVAREKSHFRIQEISLTA